MLGINSHAIVHTISRFIILASIALFLVSCATTPAKPRERYSGVDSVDTLSPKMLLGNWRVNIANPTEDENESWANTEMQSVTTFRDDGTLLSIIKSGPMGLELHTSGTWSLADSLLTTSAISTENKSDNLLGTLAAGFLTSFKDNMTGTANIYEATDDKLLLVNEEQGVAIEYTRI